MRDVICCSLVLLTLSANAASAEIDCAQCRVVCRTGTYPDNERPELSTHGVRHASKEAEAAFNAAKAKDPGFGGTDARAAVEGYKRAVLLDPQNSQYRNHLAAALLTVGNVDEAIYNLEQAIRLVPSEPKYLVNLGYAWHRRGDEQRALVWYLRALILDPRDTRARLFSGYAMEILGMASEAILEFRRVLLSEPDNKGALAALKRLGAPLNPETPPPSPMRPLPPLPADK